MSADIAPFQIAENNVLSFTPDPSRSWVVVPLGSDQDQLQIPVVGWAVVHSGTFDGSTETTIQPVVLGHELMPETQEDYNRYQGTDAHVIFTLRPVTPGEWLTAAEKWIAG